MADQSRNIHRHAGTLQEASTVVANLGPHFRRRGRQIGTGSSSYLSPRWRRDLKLPPSSPRKCGPPMADETAAAWAQSIKVDGGRLDLACATLPILIAYAFRISPARVNGPDWMSVSSPKFIFKPRSPTARPKIRRPKCSKPHASMGVQQYQLGTAGRHARYGAAAPTPAVDKTGLKGIA